MQKVYGKALFSIPVNLEYGCPNRDKEGKGGCSFCPEHGARAAQIADAKSVEKQKKKLEKLLQMLQKKQDKKYQMQIEKEFLQMKLNYE